MESGGELVSGFHSNYWVWNTHIATLFCPLSPDQPDPNNLYWLLNFSWEIKQLSGIAVVNDNFLQKHV